ncbi:DNA-directed RNA polymerase I subunit RPA12 [Sitophilus oryzae]|uniref:DNA-directed RNA polymerase subunit n=1 Tax=Sitophilus oryzae TaxID=7048 RepID=A0A6J2YSR0_SITOR|nr:DNA-directed RNA polymerase I subunit RPA12 [Sitophilus oryzae]
MSSSFKKVAGFCSDCGSILPPLRDIGNIVCYTCSKEYKPEMLIDENSTVHYTIHFNSRHVQKKRDDLKVFDDEKEEDEGPIVERKCPKCDNNKMSYATIQLRSADEGQTVFYTCTKCKYKESENS